MVEKSIEGLLAACDFLWLLQGGPLSCMREPRGGHVPFLSATLVKCTCGRDVSSSGCADSCKSHNSMDGKHI